MTRRRFLGAAIAAGGAVMVAPHLGCGGPTVAPVPVPAPGPGQEGPAAPPAEPPADLAGPALIEALLARIEAMDRRGPELRAMIAVNPDALADARALDDERRAGKLRGPLHGRPVVIKDNIETAGAMATTAGSLALAGSRAGRDAPLVARLRAAGCVILGKNNLSEWANIRSMHSVSGWSAVGGQCRNPHVLDRNPCGSSSGTGAAVAAGYATLGVGTETDGSIMCPASACGVVGIKPTVGLVSRHGVVPISRTQDTAGPICATVADAAALLSVMAGVDQNDVATAAADLRRADYSRALDAGGLKGATIGVLRSTMGAHAGVDALTEAALRDLAAAGATVIDVDLPELAKVGNAEMTVMLYELKAGMARYLAGRPDAPVKSLADVIAFNKAHAAEEMAWFGQELFEKAEATSGLDAPEYRDALARCLAAAREHGIDAVVAQHHVDAIVAPAGGPAWITDPINGDHFSVGSSTAAAVAGYPAICVPMGQVGPLPVGLSFFGPAWSEATLIRLAYAYEQKTRHRKSPRYLARI